MGDSDIQSDCSFYDTEFDRGVIWGIVIYIEIGHFIIRTLIEGYRE